MRCRLLRLYLARRGLILFEHLGPFRAMLFLKAEPRLLTWKLARYLLIAWVSNIGCKFVG